jgi:tetratricopeptide (TPR) repeat protein
VKKFTVFFVFSFSVILLSAQQPKSAAPDEDFPPGRAPVLLREEVDKEKPPVARDPAKAEEDIKVGDFYFKRANYPAAIGRYREALQSRPDYPPVYEKLIRALEKNNDLPGARRLMQEYVNRFPDQKKASDYARLLGLPGSK